MGDTNLKNLAALLKGLDLIVQIKANWALSNLTGLNTKPDCSIESKLGENLGKNDITFVLKVCLLFYLHSSLCNYRYTRSLFSHLHQMFENVSMKYNVLKYNCQ